MIAFSCDVIEKGRAKRHPKHAESPEEELRDKNLTRFLFVV
jgi:hypothetical protein